MSPDTKRIVLIAGGFLLISAVTIGAIGATVFDAGMLVVQVREEGGSDVSIKVPAVLVHAAVRLVPNRCFEEARAEMGAEYDRVRPAVRALWRELEDVPDFVLVEVAGRDEQVLVRKQSGRLVIDVDSDRERVHLVIPLRTVDSILGRLERAA
ncbi:MAG: hypothetical protein GF346_09205 [Candidatus Eisenbacteria bacterium]|nr:hypothetical protein [Candidatus Latescibacterota bacterium]MBD3302608.1 hypothetical protein [Candidatus Eisenbacteria bacterium]